MHFCPVPPKAPTTAHCAAKSKSASSMTTSGFFEPISACNLAMFVAAAAATCLPVWYEPVKVTASTSFAEASFAPMPAPPPISKLKTPAGMSCFAMISDNATADAGVRVAGFHTTALPKASAGASFQLAVAIGKFHGEMTATTPNASRRTSMSTPSRTESALSPDARRVSAAK